MLQGLFNGVLGAQFDVFLPFQPRLWTFMTPAWVQFPKWECTWESLGSIPCTFPHLWKCVSHPNIFFWPYGLLHSTLSHEPNVRVATFLYFILKLFHQEFSSKSFFSCFLSCFLHDPSSNSFSFHLSHFLVLRFFFFSIWLAFIEQSSYNFVSSWLLLHEIWCFLHVSLVSF